MSTTRLVTRTGRIVDLLDPKPEQICAQDIAWALAHEMRWNGCLGLLSVAQHSCAVAQLLEGYEPIIRLFGLLHDASEAYIGDVASPVKGAVAKIAEDMEEEECSDLELLELGVQGPITRALIGRMPSEGEAAIVSRADKLCARIEAWTFGRAHWKDAIRAVAPDYFKFQSETPKALKGGKLWSPPDATQIFLETYDSLKGEIERA